MSEFTLDRESAFSLDSRFYCPPFCNPEAPHDSGLEIIKNFNPGAAADSVLLQRAASAVYEFDKVPPESEIDKPSGIDLCHPASVKGFLHHTFTHAVTGLVRRGVSNTRVIPYWDREASIAGVARITPDQATAIAEETDALSINFLRADSRHCVQRAREAATYHQALLVAMPKGQRSKQDSGPEQERELTAVQHEFEVYSAEAAANIKHLLWLVDEQSNPKIRHFLFQEIVNLAHAAVGAGIPVERLGLDMGVDTGISEGTHRPPYDIKNFLQLRYLGEQTYSLPEEGCHRLSLGDMLRSIARSGHTLPAYEADGRYRLPLRFDD